MTETDVCNMALGLIGANTITSLADGSNTSKQCSLFYRQSRDELLRLVDWNFSLKRVKLTSLTEDTETYDNWSYAYILPDDCLRVLGLSAYNPQAKEYSPFPDWKVENGSLLSESEDLTLLYSRRVDDSESFDALFVKTLVFNLASYLAVAIKQSPDMRDVYYSLFQEALIQARNTNTIEKRAKSSSTWLTDRSEDETRSIWPNTH